MPDPHQSRERALHKYFHPGQERFPITAKETDAFRAGYDAALADNAERVREAEEQAAQADNNHESRLSAIHEQRKRADAAESALAEARSIADRPLGTHIDYEPMDMIRDLQKALGVLIYDRDPCRCGNVKYLAEARATIERVRLLPYGSFSGTHWVRLDALKNALGPVKP